MIELYQFPPAKKIPSFSPFCLKLEAFLLLSELPYESHVVFNPAEGPKGKLPFVVIEGEKIGDSALVIDLLKSRHGELIDKHLSEKQRSLTVAYQVMLEEHLALAMVYFRWQDEAGWESFAKNAFFGSLPKALALFVPRLARKQTVSNLLGHGMGRHKAEEVLALAKKDIKALSVLLGDGEFFFNGKPSLLDVIAFAVIGNILAEPAERPLPRMVREYPGLVAHSERMLQLFRKQGEGAGGRATARPSARKN